MSHSTELLLSIMNQIKKFVKNSYLINYRTSHFTIARKVLISSQSDAYLENLKQLL